MDDLKKELAASKHMQVYMPLSFMSLVSECTQCVNSVLVSPAIRWYPGRKHAACCAEGSREGDPTELKWDCKLTLTHEAGGSQQSC